MRQQPSINIQPLFLPPVLIHSDSVIRRIIPISIVRSSSEFFGKTHCTLGCCRCCWLVFLSGPVHFLRPRSAFFYSGLCRCCWYSAMPVRYFQPGGNWYRGFHYFGFHNDFYW